MDRREEEAEAKRRRIKSKEDETITKFFEMIPLDLIHEILLRLPAKSAARFRCVSKLWSSITTRPYFIRSFATQSSTRLCLLVCVITREKRLFISLPQHEHSNMSYSHVDRSKRNAPKIDYYAQSESVQGLMCFRYFYGSDIVVWNPTMRQHVTLPKVRFLSSSFLGYDPVEDKYKVFCFPECGGCQNPLVFTLGPQESWRVTQSYPKHSLIYPTSRICINGHLFYEAMIRFRVDDTYKDEEILMSVDVRYEKFNIIKKPADDQLSSLFINYQGKLALVCYDISCIRFWVLEDEDKQEWSLRKFRPFTSIPLCDPSWKEFFVLKGITHDTGEFIFIGTTYKEITVLYYDPKRNSIRRIIYNRGIDEEVSRGRSYYVEKRFHYYPNHSESLMSLENVPRLEFD